MSYKIGMPTLLELNSLDLTVSLCNELNLKLIEISMTRPEFFHTSLNPDNLLSISDKNNIEFTLHLPEEIDLSSFHDPIRNACLKMVLEIIEWADKSNIRNITMHLPNGTYYTLPQGRTWLYDVYKTKYHENFALSIKQIIQAAKNHNIKLCIENCNNFYLSFIKETIDKNLDLFITWDVGHDADSDFKETNIIMENEHRVAHMHLHDSINSKSHKELYTGNVKIDEMISFAQNKDIRIIVEVKTIELLKKSVSKLRQKYIF